MSQATKNIKAPTAKTSLSTRLLYLTISFVMLAQLLIFIPSISNYRKTWLEEHLAAAHIASLAVKASPHKELGDMLTNELLETAEIVAVRHIGAQNSSQDLNIRPILGEIPESKIEEFYDLSNPSFWQLLKDAARTLAHTHPHKKLVSVTAFGADTSAPKIQIIFNEERLCHDMWHYSWNSFLLSLFISLITAGVIYFALNHLFVKPVQTITQSLINFREKPEDQTPSVQKKNRSDEIGLVMSEMKIMQDKIRQALNQKNHLAHLGEAVSKINHDLRNMLSSAQLVSDHLIKIDDPEVKKLAPYFISAIDRAIRLCNTTLEYSSAEIKPSQFKKFSLKPVIEDVYISLGAAEDSPVNFTHHIPQELKLQGDADQIFRVFMNLCRNALQALKTGGEIIIELKEDPEKILIIMKDTAGGIPKNILKDLFKPFSSSAKEGTGLGLAISKEIMQAHGGDIRLLSSTEKGTAFLIAFPKVSG